MKIKNKTKNTTNESFLSSPPYFSLFFLPLFLYLPLSVPPASHYHDHFSIYLTFHFTNHLLPSPLPPPPDAATTASPLMHLLPKIKEQFAAGGGGRRCDFSSPDAGQRPPKLMPLRIYYKFTNTHLDNKPNGKETPACVPRPDS